MKVAFSEDFLYENVDFVTECDASYSEDNKAGIGWTILDKPEEQEIAEFRKTVRAKSSIHAEVIGVSEALRSLSEFRDVETIIIRTDLDTIVSEFNSDNLRSLFSSINEELDNFDEWCIESVERQDIDRPHSLANSALNQLKYTED